MRWGFLHHLVHVLVDNVHIAAALQSQALFPQFQEKIVKTLAFPKKNAYLCIVDSQ